MLRILALNLLSAGLLTSLVAIQRGWGWPALLASFAVSLIYSSVIGTSSTLVLPRVARRLAGRAPAAYWLGLAATLLGLAVAGSAVAGMVAGALGLFGRGMSWSAFRTGLGTAVVITMSVGMGIALYETTRARLDVARENLRARELEVERARRLATDARMASLESRLHPHFLFNAIAAIAGQVREEPERAERLLVEFADLLRASLDSTQRHTVPLGDEVAIVRAYLEIEQARLGDRLRCTVDVPDDLLEWPVPPFALHTLVQNSVKHVASARTAGAAVRVEARRAAGGLVLSVWDDGPGFDLAGAPPGHGLETLRARLAVLFAGEAALGAAREDGGARVTMALPAHAAIAERE